MKFASGSESLASETDEDQKGNINDQEESDASAFERNSSRSECESDSGNSSTSQGSNPRQSNIFKSNIHTSKLDSADESGSNNSGSPDGKQFKKNRVSDLKQCWEENPDVYGIRRSGRSRKEPERLNAADSDSGDRIGQCKRRKSSSSENWHSGESSEDERSSSSHTRPPPPSKRIGSRCAVKLPSKRKMQLSESDRSTESSEDELSDQDSDPDGKRNSSRRAATKVSYKEHSDKGTDSEDLIEVDWSQYNASVEDGSEMIEKILNKRVGKKGCTGAQTTVYAVEENGDPNILSTEEDLESQYLIKWKGWSHLHNTWETEESLRVQKARGLKKLLNYVKREEEIALWKRFATREDIEYFECQAEMSSELTGSYTIPERIIAENRKPDGNSYEYYVKWENLPYSESTWEDGDLVVKKYPLKLEEFHARQDSKRIPSKLCRVLKYRPKFIPMKTQPDYMGSGQLQLRDYQLDGVNWLVLSWCKENSVILADEMGLGKTIQTICFLNYLHSQHMLYGPFLVVVPLSTMNSWQREFALWAADLNVIMYIGDVTSRNIIRQHEWCHPGNKRQKFNVVITTYEILLKDKSFLGGTSWAVLMVDEAHRLKNDDSLLYKALWDFDTNHRLLITGTPLQNSLKELWSLLHFIMPSKFEFWETFEEEHKHSSERGYGKLHRQLEPFIFRRVKKDVEKSLPAKVEQILRVDMTAVQRQYYKWILTKNYAALRKGSKGNVGSFINIVMELKKCCNHAFLTKPLENSNSMSQLEYLQQLLKSSGKLLLLDKLLVRLKETGHRVLIFSQMVMMLDIIGEYLQLKHFSFQRMDGSIKGELRRQALDHFNAEGSTDFCFLLSTRAGGLGINLATADTVIIFDSDWNPQNDLQAQARAHRIGQKNQVNIYRLVTKNSVEEDIIERAKRKMVLDHLVIQRMDTSGRTILDKKAPSTNTTPFNKEELNAILKFGAEGLFKDEEDGEEEPICDIDEILRRAETREEEGPSTAGDELLSAFKVASFSFDENEDISVAVPVDNMDTDTKDWESIIPEQFRKKIEEEDRQKEMEDLYLPPRNRKSLQQIQQEQEDSDDANKSHKKRKLKADEGSKSEEESDDDRPKKRGRPRLAPKENIKGLTDAEIRRFVKAFKKFPSPLNRLEAIACDAELQEKPLSDLKKLGDLILQRCSEALNESMSKKENEIKTDGKRRERVSFKISGVTVNAKTMMANIDELEPLELSVPSDPNLRRSWVMDCNVKDPHWGVEWSIEDDSRLLKGIYIYGIGSWESIKMDPSLDLSEKILPPGADAKPQVKHLQSRADYLLKLLKKHTSGKTKIVSPRKSRKVAESKAKSKAIIEYDDISSDEESKKSIKKPKLEPLEPGEVDSSCDKYEVEEKKLKKKKVKKSLGPMHYTTHEPVAVDVMGELDPDTFTQCKEKMRPVKKYLKQLDNPDPTLEETEQLIHTRHCLKQIGDHITKCLDAMTDVEAVKIWRSNLWYFVSKFTEFDAKKLFKLYKLACKKEKNEHKDGKEKNKEPDKKEKTAKDDKPTEGKSRDKAKARQNSSADGSGDGHNRRSHKDGDSKEHSKDRDPKREHANHESGYRKDDYKGPARTASNYSSSYQRSSSYNRNDRWTKDSSGYAGKSKVEYSQQWSPDSGGYYRDRDPYSKRNYPRDSGSWENPWPGPSYPNYGPPEVDYSSSRDLFVNSVNVPSRDPRDPRTSGHWMSYHKDSREYRRDYERRPPNS